VEREGVEDTKSTKKMKDLLVPPRREEGGVLELEATWAIRKLNQWRHASCPPL
jgi:hypothetical protein